MFSEEKVVAVRVLPKLDDLYSMARKLKHHREALAFYRHRNQVSGGTDREQVGKTCCLFGGRSQDAEELFHKAKITRLCADIEAERDKRSL